MPSQIDLSNPMRAAAANAGPNAPFLCFILVCCLGKDAAGAVAVTAVSFSQTVDSFTNRVFGANQPIQLSNTVQFGASRSSLALTRNPTTQSNNCSKFNGRMSQINVTFKPTANHHHHPYRQRYRHQFLRPSLACHPAVSLSQADSAPGATRTIILINTGTAALRIASLALTGTNATSLRNPIIAHVARHGSHCTISVTLAPASGARTAAITLTDNATSSPQAVSLTGTGTSSCEG